MTNKTQHFGYEEEDLYLLRETFVGDGVSTTFQLTGNLGNATFETGSWDVGGVKTAMQAYASKTTGAGLYDSVLPLVRHKISVSSISAGGLVTLSYAPMAESFYVWYWYDISTNGSALEDYYRDDFVAFVEGDEDTTSDVASDINTDTTNFNGVLSVADDTVQKALDTLDNLRLDQIAAPNANKTFNMATKSISFTFTDPTNAPTYDGAFEIEATGAFTGDLLHVHQHTGNPGAGTHLIHLEATDADVVPLGITGTYAYSIEANAKIKGTVLESTAVGVPPLVVAATETVTNLTVDRVDGYHASGTVGSSGSISLSASFAVLTGTAGQSITIGHLTTSGNKHVPTGGSTGQILRHTGTAGTAGWGTVTETSGALAAVTTISMSGQLTNTLAVGTAPFVITSTTAVANLNADLWDGYQFSDYLDQAVKQASSPTFATVKLTGLASGYIPYHVDDALGLADSIIQTDGTQIGVGVIPDSIFHVVVPFDNSITTVANSILTGTSRLILRNTDGTLNNTVGLVLEITETAVGQARGGVVLQRTGNGAAHPTLSFVTDPSNGAPVERVRITADGDMLILGGTVSCSDLTDGYVPYHVSDAAGLANSRVFQSGSSILIGTTTVSSFMTAGLLLNQAGSDDEILAFQSSDISQPYTTVADASTFAKFQKLSASTGGLRLYTFSEATSSASLQFELYVGNTDPTDTTPAWTVNFYKSDGAGGVVVFADDETLFQIRNRTTERFTLLGDGSIGINTVTPQALLEIEDLATANTILQKITADDNLVYGLMVGNDTFSTTDAQGIGIWQANTGQGNIRVGVAPYSLYLGCLVETYHFGDPRIVVQTGTTAGYRYRGIMVTDILTDASAKGALAIMGARHGSSTEVPFSVLGAWDSGTARTVYIGGGGWTAPDASAVSIYTCPYTENNNEGVIRLAIDANGMIVAGENTPIAEQRFRVAHTTASIATTNIGLSLIDYPTQVNNGNLAMIGMYEYCFPILNTGVNSTSYVAGYYSQVVRNSRGAAADDTGTMNAMYGMWVLYGHSNVNAATTPVTSALYGLRLSPQYNTGTVGAIYDLYISTPTTGGTLSGAHYAVYQQAATAYNYFGGHTGIHAAATSTAALTVSQATTNASESCIYSTNSGNTVTTTVSAAYYNYMISMGIGEIVAAGVTDSGALLGSQINVFRNARAADSDDGGTLTQLAGAAWSYGHYNTNAAATPVTTNMYGLKLQPYLMTGTISQNIYDVYIPAITGTGTLSGTHYHFYQAQYSGVNIFASKSIFGLITATNSKQTYGILIHQSTSDDDVIACQSTDVGHSMTGLADASTFFSVAKASATLGGAIIRGFSDGNGLGLSMRGSIGSNDPTDSTVPAVEIVGAKYDAGTNITDLASAESLLFVRNNATLRFAVYGDGNVGIGGNCARTDDLMNMVFSPVNDSGAYPINITYSPEATLAGTYNYFGLNLSMVNIAVTAGVANAGVMGGMQVSAYANTAAAAGSIGSIEGAEITYGFTTSVADGFGVAGNIYGLYLQGYWAEATSTVGGDVYEVYMAASAGATVTGVHYGLYQANTAGVNYLAKKTVIGGSGGLTHSTSNTRGLVVNQVTWDDDCLTLQSTDVIHPITAQADDYTFAQFKKNSATLGGLFLQTFSEADAVALNIRGCIGASNPTDTVAAVELRGAKSDAGTGLTALASAETVFKFYNNTTVIATAYGNGSWSFGTDTISTPQSQTIYAGSDLTDPTSGYRATLFIAENTYTTGNADLHVNYASGFTKGFIVAAGQTMSGANGSEGAIIANAFRNYISASNDDDGTWSGYSYAVRLLYGHNNVNAASTPQTTTFYGILLQPYYQTGKITNLYDIYIDSPQTGGTAPDNHYAIYQELATAKNYFAGNVTIGVDDATVGILSLYGGGAGADGGVVKVYLGADDDASIAYYGIQVVEDDLLIGPDTNTNALKLTAEAVFQLDDGITQQFYRALGTDHTASGITENFTAGENLVFGELCYLKSDGKMWKADADAATTMPCMCMALATIAGDASGKFLLYGWVRDDDWNFTVGGFVYVDTTTAGATNQTAPSGNGDQVQIVGIAYSADILFFNPQYAMVEVVA